jgi:hypothetical protein
MSKSINSGKKLLYVLVHCNTHESEYVCTIIKLQFSIQGRILKVDSRFSLILTCTLVKPLQVSIEGCCTTFILRNTLKHYKSIIPH